jgi:hypothetical protein
MCGELTAQPHVRSHAASLHQDFQRKMNYLEKNEKKENWNDYMSAGIYQGGFYGIVQH